MLDQVTLELKKLADEQKKEKLQEIDQIRKNILVALKKPKPNKDKEFKHSTTIVHPIVQEF